MAVFNNILAGAAGQGVTEGPIKSVRFEDGDDAYLSRTPSTAGNRETWTWSSWVKLNREAYENLFSNLVNNNNGLYVYWTNGTFYINDSSLSGGANLASTSLFRDFSAWYHIVIVYDTTQATASDRVKVYINGVQETLTGTYPNQNVDGWWNSTATCFIGRQSNNVALYNFSGYLADIYFIDGQALEPTQFGVFDVNNVWKARSYNGAYGTNGFHLLDFANESTVGHDSSGNNNDFTAYNIINTSGNGYGETVSAVPYGGSAAAVLNADLTDNIRVATTNYSTPGYYTVTFSNPIPITSSVVCRVFCPSGASNMFRIRINDTTDTILPDDNTQTDLTLNLGGATSLSKLDFRTTGSGSGYGADLYYIKVDGNIIYSDSTYSQSDVSRDVPTNATTNTDSGIGGEISGNYCVLNELDKQGSVTLSNGNLQTSLTGITSFVRGSLAVSSGKWYWEFVSDTLGMHGIGNVAYTYNNWYSGTEGYFYYGGSGAVYESPNNGSTYGETYNNSDVIGVAFDADNGNLYFYKNGVIQNSGTAAFTGLTGTYAPIFSDGAGSGVDVRVNFGATDFVHNAPSGYKALCTANLTNTTVTTSGSYEGNSSGDGPFVYLNGVPTAMSIGGSPVTFGTGIDKLSNGFKIRSATTNNTSGTSYSFNVTATGDSIKTSRAQVN